MLQKQNVPVILGLGLDTKRDQKVVPAGKMLVLENAVFTKAQSLKTRFGYDEIPLNVLGTASTIVGPRKVLSFQNEMLLIGKDRIYSYIPSNQTWADRGGISSILATSKSIVRNTKSQSVPDSGSLKGITVYAWEDSVAGITVSAIDDSSGLPVVTEQVLSSSGVKPKVAVNKNYIFVYYIEGSNWKVSRYSPDVPNTFEGALTVAVDIENNYDIKTHGDNMVFIYNTTGGNCEVGFLANTGLLGDPLSGFPTSVNTTNPGDSCVCITSTFEGLLSDRIYAFYANTTNGLSCTVYNLDLTAVGTTILDGTTTVIRNITAINFNSTLTRCYYELTGSFTYFNIIYRVDIQPDAAIGTSSDISVRGLGLIGKAFLGNDDNIYIPCGYESALQSSTFVMKETFANINSPYTLDVASVISLGESGGLTDKLSSLANVTTNFTFANVVKTKLVSENNNIFNLQGVQATTLDVSNQSLFQSKELGNNLHIAGGVLFDYDGKSAFEHGYFLFPENISNSISGGGAINAGTRLYSFCYEWTDNQGQVHQSAPSVPLSVTNSLNDTNTFTVPTLRITKRTSFRGRSNIRIVGYRTLASGTVFYRFTSLSSSFFNDININTVTVTDAAADSTINTNDVLYTTGGVLENYTTGSCLSVDEYRNRLVVAGLEDGNKIRYSKVKEQNSAVNFSEEFDFRLDSGFGPIYAARELDEKLIIFKESQIYLQVGNGPLSTGFNNDYQEPILVTSDVGCDEPSSIVTMPLGLMFKSNKGYYLLTRSLESVYIGEDVEDFNNLTCTGAQLLEDFNEVRFTHSDGVVLSYHYGEKQWSTFTNLISNSSTVWSNNGNRKFVSLKTNGTLFVENPDTYFDGQSAIKKNMSTSWIQVAQIQGAQRVYRILLIGKLESQHQLRIRLSYDFSPAMVEEFVFDTETILGSSYYGEGYYGQENPYGGVDPVYQIEIRPKKQKCQAIQLHIDDLNPNGINGAGFELTALTFQVGIKQGLFRINMDKRIAPRA